MIIKEFPPKKLHIQTDELTIKYPLHPTQNTTKMQENPYKKTAKNYFQIIKKNLKHESVSQKFHKM
jgi:hypothetical protein